LALNLRASNKSFDATKDNSASVALNGVVAGNLIVGWIGWEADAGLSDQTITVSDGTTSATIGTKNLFGTGADGDPCGYFWWILSSVASGNLTYSCTISGNVQQKFMAVMEFNVDAGDTVSKDQENATAEGTGSAFTSGTITTTGTDVVILGGFHVWTLRVTPSGWKIGGVAADGQEYYTTDYKRNGALWYKITTGTNITAYCDGGNDEWVCSVVSFKSTAGEAGGANQPYQPWMLRAPILAQ
jgi:hypothetical protein